MVWDRIKRMLGGKVESGEPGPVRTQAPQQDRPPAPAQDMPEVRWIEAADNPWGVRLLDVRPVTLTMTSTSADPQCAANAVSYGGEDGTVFVGQAPDSPRVVDMSLCFPVDAPLLDGVLFVPRAMEHKWALFFQRGELIVVRSWVRKVVLVARVEARDGHVEITQARGTLCADDETPEFTTRALDYLVRSHALDIVHPAPLPPGMDADPKAAALWCMSVFGNRAQVATPHVFARREPERPLRTHSLLHIAVARGQVDTIEVCLQAGMPIDALAGDGLAPLHWALASPGNEIATLLLDRGASVDVRSEEGATPLMNAVQSANLEQVALLLDHGADANARDLRGFTALHRAAEMGLVDITGLLLARGASIDVDAEGHTPRSLAIARDCKDILALLDRHAVGEG